MYSESSPLSSFLIEIEAKQFTTANAGNSIIARRVSDVSPVVEFTLPAFCPFEKYVLRSTTPFTFKPYGVVYAGANQVFRVYVALADDCVWSGQYFSPDVQLVSDLPPIKDQFTQFAI